MCLTLCRQRSLIYDSDRGIVCNACPLAKKKEVTDDCQSCSHFFAEKKICLLTSMSIPTTNWCCHYNSPSKLDYFPRNLKNDAEGIVLVPQADFAEAMDDYLYSNPKLMLRLGLPGAPQPETNTEPTIFDEFDWDLFDKQIINDVAPKATELDLETNFSADDFQLETDYVVLSQEEAANSCFVPIIVGDELVIEHQGVQGLIEWFEAFFGGKSDIMKDWKGRWIVKSHRFAIPGVYGIIAEKWSSLLENEDLTDILHELFS